ncbi:hypothetical protein BC831DRAFT_456089 [Entophlyctis helioformis]|nr:hypothetical protein BC831DRAFT_456089 [Entophlyctis helioformis]
MLNTANTAAMAGLYMDDTTAAAMGMEVAAATAAAASTAAARRLPPLVANGGCRDRCIAAAEERQQPARDHSGPSQPPHPPSRTYRRSTRPRSSCTQCWTLSRTTQSWQPSGSRDWIPRGTMSPGRTRSRSRTCIRTRRPTPLRSSDAPIRAWSMRRRSSMPAASSPNTTSRSFSRSSAWLARGSRCTVPRPSPSRTALISGCSFF